MILLQHFKYWLPVNEALTEKVLYPQELSPCSKALFGLSYLDDLCFVPPKSNLLYLVHTRLSLPS